jgi:hypothetical protein
MKGDLYDLRKTLRRRDVLIQTKVRVLKGNDTTKERQVQANPYQCT